ncbi:MAG: Uncharacterized conserved protein YcbK, DUF882 family [Chloroflexi bacterium]|jgi:hypothetical protein|nr:MAG: Uncharacterized conserved protein YcbK, DUF882 family [Chloroflexota bacterium]
MKLSEHFTLEEFTKSQVAKRYRIDNIPSPGGVENLKKLCLHILEPVRKYYNRPISPSSGFRCVLLNRQIGSSDTSQHITGQAVDFEVPGVSNKDTALWIKDELDFDELILEFYKEGEPHSGWVHCSYVGQSNRKKSRKYDGRTWSNLS